MELNKKLRANLREQLSFSLTRRILIISILIFSNLSLQAGAGIPRMKVVPGIAIINDWQLITGEGTFLLVLFSFILASSVVVFFAMRYNNQQQLKEIREVREKISSDLHDDIGSSLSSLQIYATVASETIDTDLSRSKVMMKKIIHESRQVMENMNDMVWSMKPYSPDGSTLSAHLRNYAARLLHEKNISFNISLEDDIDCLLKNMVARKNLLLLVKEAITNIAKHSAANFVSVKMKIRKQSLLVVIKDDGIGFAVGKHRKGNGIYNMNRRIKELDGRLDFVSSEGSGTMLTAIIPVKSFKAHLS